MNRMNSAFKPSWMHALVGVSLCLFATVAGCQAKPDAEAGTQWVESAATDDASVANALQAKLALRINLNSNRATLYKDGKVADQWNIASADVKGEFHDKIPQSTPTGIFTAEDMQVCPTWLPRSPKDPATGKLAANEQERQAIFKNNPDLFGPCGAKNPLGSYVIWFNGEYGVHGNAAEWILDLEKADERRVSGGCIRNPNAKIKELFHLVLDTFASISGFKTATLAMEAAAKKSTLTQSLSGVDLKVVVGRWDADPNLGENKQPSPPPPVTKPAEPKKLICSVTSIDETLGIAPVHSELPATQWNVVSFYDKDDSAYVLEEISGSSFVRTHRGFIDKKYFGSCQSQN